MPDAAPEATHVASMSMAEQLWWGVVDFHTRDGDAAERRESEVLARAEDADGVEVIGTEPGHIVLQWSGRDRADAVRRITELTGAEQVDFAPTYPRPA